MLRLVIQHLAAGGRSAEAFVARAFRRGDHSAVLSHLLSWAY